LTEILSGSAGLWLTVIGVGLYHGVNPGMGWPLAVSAALMEDKPGAMVRALAALAVGHFASMLGILLPFAFMYALVDWQREIQIVAGCLVIGLGLFLLINRRHPRFLARVPPSRLALWSFLVALAHGAGLMLVPIYLGLCRLSELDAGHQAAASLMGSNAGLAIAVAVVHTAAMIIAGGCIAAAVYRWLGLKFLTKGWFDLDVLWALSLVIVGLIALYSAY
jgi:hypothetical protein